MDSELLNIAASQGIWAVLSMALIIYILKAQEKRDDKQELREQNYQKLLHQLIDKLNIVEDAKKDVEEIKGFVFENSKKT